MWIIELATTGESDTDLPPIAVDHIETLVAFLKRNDSSQSAPSADSTQNLMAKFSPTLFSEEKARASPDGFKAPPPYIWQSRFNESLMQDEVIITKWMGRMRINWNFDTPIHLLTSVYYYIYKFFSCQSYH